MRVHKTRSGQKQENNLIVMTISERMSVMLVIAKNVKYEDCGSLSNRLRRKQRCKVEIENRAAASNIIMMVMMVMMA